MCCDPALGDSLDAMESGSGSKGGGGGGDKGEGAGGATKRKRKQARSDPRTIIVGLSLLSCLATMAGRCSCHSSDITRSF
jgi:hypothetical protein